MTNLPRRGEKWALFLDDVRLLHETVDYTTRDWCVARSTEDAIFHVTFLGMPEFISFDHDLGGDDTSMEFLKWLTDKWLDGEFGDYPIPEYQIHSANPIGAANIKSWMETWKKAHP